MTLTCLYQRRDHSWVKLTLARSHTRLRPALREQGSSRWVHAGEDKVLVRRWHAELGKWRLLVQHKPVMTDAEKAAWTSPSHLEDSRRFQ